MRPVCLELDGRVPSMTLVDELLDERSSIAGIPKSARGDLLGVDLVVVKRDRQTAGRSYLIKECNAGEEPFTASRATTLMRVASLEHATAMAALNGNPATR